MTDVSDDSLSLPDFCRLFIAVPIPDPVRRELSNVQAILNKADAHVRWVPAENLHLSLLFLGDISRNRIAALTHVLEIAANSAAPGTLEVKCIGSFGRHGNPRVIWAGCRESGALSTLYNITEGSLQEIGLDTDKRPFHPHITLGRVKSSRGREALGKVMDAVGEAEFGEMPLAGMDLMMSSLTPEGAMYRTLRSFPLARQM